MTTTPQAGVKTVSPPFSSVGLVGLGLLGGSLALAIRSKWPGVRLCACVRTPTREAHAVVDEVTTDVEAVAGSDLVVIATPVDAMPRVFAALAQSGSEAVVTDMGSTKRTVMTAASDAGLRRFVGGHPMAGGERPGLALARADLFEGRPWLLVKGSAEPEAGHRLEVLVEALGARPQWLDAETHDRTVAFVSHLPQVISAALMNAVDEAVGLGGRAAAGRAFAEMTRLASSPREMWTGVLVDNADFVREAIEAFLSELPADPAEDLGAWADDSLTRSGETRRRWLER